MFAGGQFDAAERHPLPIAVTGIGGDMERGFPVQPKREIVPSLVRDFDADTDIIESLIRSGFFGLHVCPFEAMSTMGSIISAGSEPIPVRKLRFGPIAIIREAVPDKSRDMAV